MPNNRQSFNNFVKLDSQQHNQSNVWYIVPVSDACKGVLCVYYTLIRLSRGFNMIHLLLVCISCGKKELCVRIRLLGRKYSFGGCWGNGVAPAWPMPSNLNIRIILGENGFIPLALAVLPILLDPSNKCICWKGLVVMVTSMNVNHRQMQTNPNSFKMGQFVKLHSLYTVGKSKLLILCMAETEAVDYCPTP